MEIFNLGKERKVWGDTSCLFLSNFCSVHLLEVKKGGFCSRHYHRKKWNRFILVKGKIRVISYGSIYEKNREDVYTLSNPGDSVEIPPYVIHKFECLEDSTVIEVCWVVFDSDDIIRFEQGGRRE